MSLLVTLLTITYGIGSVQLQVGSLASFAGYGFCSAHLQLFMYQLIPSPLPCALSTIPGRSGNRELFTTVHQAIHGAGARVYGEDHGHGGPWQGCMRDRTMASHSI